MTKSIANKTWPFTGSPRASYVSSDLTGSLVVPPPTATYNSLFNFDTGSGTSLPNWTYSENVSGTTGSRGWVLDNGATYNGMTGTNFGWGAGPRLFNKTDYGAANTASFDTVTYAPSKTSGASLKVDSNADNLCSWWVYFSSDTLSEIGVADNTTDRMEFYLRLDGMDSATLTGTSTARGVNVHIGTYLCSGSGCDDREGIEGGGGNQHYYHYLSLEGDAWVKVSLDPHPQNLRGNIDPDFEPILATDSLYYFPQMSSFYVENISAQSQAVTMYIDEINLLSTDDEEADQDPNIASVWVGYWSSNDQWRIGWFDEATTRSDNGWATYEIRYSNAPITNANYASATVVTPTAYSGTAYTSYPNGVRAADPYRGQVATYFQLPDGFESANDKVYFAIKDVSVAGQNAGTNFPWNKVDESTGPNKIRTISYDLRTQ